MASIPNVDTFQLLDHGEDGSQYFPGCGTAFTEYAECVTGIGDTAREALEDALESAAQNDARFSAAQEAEMLSGLSNPDKSAFESLDHSECDEDHSNDDWHHYVSIRYSLVNGYHDCDCCSEIIVDARLCPECTEAACEPNSEGAYDNCQRADREDD